jgi:pimeloyl-ACP methyl ester carboxylesterase
VQQKIIRGAGGVAISAEISGEPTARTVVLLHALGDRGADWGAVARALATNFQVVNVDLRGHGNSDWSDSYSFELMRDDVIALLDALELSEVVLIGHSMGGVVAYLLAQAEPNRIAALIVEDASPPYPRTRPLPQRPEGDLPFDWAVVESIAPQVNDPSRRWWTHLPDITAPTLLIGGGPTSHVPQELLAEVAQLIPNSTLITLDAGHNIHHSLPEEFIAAVMAWLGDRHFSHRK